MQVDIRGDAYGMLAAHPVAPLVSLHHLDHIQPISPRGKTALEAVRPLVAASRLDPARALQQSICYQRGPGYVWSVSVAWGLDAVGTPNSEGESKAYKVSSDAKCIKRFRVKH